MSISKYVKTCRRGITLLAAALLMIGCLTGCGVSELYSIEQDGLTYALRGRGDRASEIEISRGGESVALLEVKGLRRGLSGESYGMTLEDVDFDGRADILLLIAAGENNRRYDCFVRGEDDTFVAKPAVSKLANLTVNAESKTLSSLTSALTIDPATDDTPAFEIRRETATFYIWDEHGELTPTERRELTYYEESDIYCYAVFEADDQGDWQDVRESWIAAERFDASKYPLSER